MAQHLWGMVHQDEAPVHSSADVAQTSTTSGLKGEPEKSEDLFPVSDSSRLRITTTVCPP